MKKGWKKVLPGVGAALLALAGGTVAKAAEKEQVYIFPDAAEELLTEEDVKDLPSQLLAYGRYEILARHGELFESKELQEYFGNQKWYFGFLSDEKEVKTLLNDCEKENLAFLEKQEKAEGEYELDQKDFDYELVEKWLDGTYVAGEEKDQKTDGKQTKETEKAEKKQETEAATEAATEAPATEAPQTEAPATETPVTEAPQTEAPATEAPATEAPQTEPPATEAPQTEAPVTEPATEAESHVTGDAFQDLSDVDLFALTPDEQETVQATEAETTAETEQETESEADERREYLFPDVDTRYLTREEVSRLSLQAVCYAKNEIYARHGRKFLSKELQDYFNDKTWYQGTVDPDRFSTSVFNTYENDNLMLLVEAEEKLQSGGYILDQSGYDIHKVDTACRHTKEKTDGTEETAGYVFVVIDSDNIMHDDARLVNGKVVDAEGKEIPGCYEREDGRVMDALGNLINPKEGQLVSEESFKK